jgi:hypothetical protein
MALSQPIPIFSTSASHSHSQSSSSHDQSSSSQVSNDKLIHLPQRTSLPAPTKESTTSLSVPSVPNPLSGSIPSLSHETPVRPGLTSKHRQSTFSLSSSTKQNRGGLFTLAALARDKTSSAIASFSEPSIRSQPSSGSLYLSAQNSPTAASQSSRSPGDSQRASHDNSDSSSPNDTPPSIHSHSRKETLSSNFARHSLLETNPPSQAYSQTASDTPAPIAFNPSIQHSKMHQTSSRLLRMTNDDRPFTRVWLS